jgi:hypothetical protein
MLVSSDCPDRAYHDARPASDTFFWVENYPGISPVFANASRNAGHGARRFLAMTALDRYRPHGAKRPLLINRFDVNSRADHGARLDRIQEAAAGCMRRGARQFTGSACQALFYLAKNSFHNSGRFF